MPIAAARADDSRVLLPRRARVYDVRMKGPSRSRAVAAVVQA